MDDSRFKKFATDPKFRLVPKKERKVKIDPRFKSMFNDKRFVTKVSVDKRGRPKSFASKENFEKFYDLQSSSSEEEEDENDAQEIVETQTEDKGRKKEQKKGKTCKEGESEDSKSDDETVARGSKKKSKVVAKKEDNSEKKKKDANSIKADEKLIKKLHSNEIDYARGESTLMSDSSSSDDSSDDESDNEATVAESVAFDKWGELDCDADSTDESTKRLAVCNMDWDRVGAKDIFVALNSFCPPGGNVKSVLVYVSEFGKERLAEEDILGPRELRESKNEATSDGYDDDGEIDAETMERIRIYQVNRLKYFYAVAEFNTVEAADKVYKECDGMEYELSATKFDLRFIPDDMTFDEEPKETCNQMPRPEDYKPKIFENTALKQGKVNLTWDETDPNRLAIMRKAFEAEDDDINDDVKAYLANSSDEEEADLPPIVSDQEEELGTSEDDEAVVNKYKALLSDIKEKQKKSKLETDMEVSWIPSDVVTEKMKQKELESMTPWEQYLAKKKEKRKAKKQKAKNVEVDDEDKPFSDDDLPDGIDPDDPFFKSTEDTNESAKDKKKKKGKKKNAKPTAEDEDKQGLSLLLMESDDDKDHFDYKEIVKKESKKSKKRKNKKANEEKEDDFKIDFNDQRFSAIFKKAEYNVDPSNPNFKKTKSMQAIIEEKQRRLLNNETMEAARPPPEKKMKAATGGQSSSLDNLVHAVKAKSNRMKMSKKK